MSSGANKIKKFLEEINIKNANEDLMSEALTHPSFNFERNIDDAPNYERLEFLGDSVLRLSLSNYLFDKYPESAEGKLTKIRSYLVSDECLAKIALSINLGEYLNIGEHEAKDGGRQKESILACAMEAVFGAIYKSLGFDLAKDFIYTLYSKLDTDSEKILYFYNPKEILQQYTQGLNKDLPEYKIQNEYGPQHKKMYEVCVIYHGEIIGTGTAKTKKEAEKIAAHDAIQRLNIQQEDINE